VRTTTEQSESQAPVVPVRVRQGAETQGRDWSWVEASGWSERMLAALETASKRQIVNAFRCTLVVQPLQLCFSEPIPMRKPPTGEPCAGEPHARFGGRGGRKPFPTPIGVGRKSTSSRQV